MKIKIAKDCVCGKVQIPPAEYWVSLQSDSQQIYLSSGGKDLKLPAIRRRTKAKAGRVTTVTFYNGGGTTWSLIVSTPKHGEWICMLEQTSGKDDDKRR